MKHAEVVAWVEADLTAAREIEAAIIARCGSPELLADVRRRIGWREGELAVLQQGAS